jgi:uncharacterized protein YecT (DUF1311 family)
MQRMNPTLLAAIALGALILLIGAMILIGNRSGEDDRLTNEASASRSDPSERCGSQSTYDEIKRELFRRAAARRGGDQDAYEKIGSYSTIRMEAPLLRDEDAGNGAVTCNGAITVDLPPGVEVPGGRRSLSADILYTVQSAVGGGAVVTLANDDEIIAPLATLVRTSGTSGEGLLPPAANEVEPAESGVVPGVEELPPADNPGIPDTSASENAAISPSFNCANARTSGEVAVCNDYRLATLDRRMATQFGSALSQATPQQRALLIQTRDAFLGYRDQCTSNDCIAETYRGRMREIRDIMTGSWHPQR